MDRAPQAVLTDTKVCRDCAHYFDDPESVFPKCRQAPRVDPVSGNAGFYSCDSQRMFDCGPKAVHFMPNERALAARSVRRMQRYEALGKAISDLRPDPSEAGELLAALMAGLKARYDDRLPDVEEAAKELNDALEEAEGVSDGFPS